MSSHIVGPFPATTMQSWYKQQYFQDTLLIQRHVPPYDPLDPEAFETLAEYKKKLPPAAEPYLFLKGMELAPSRPPNLPLPSAAPFNDDHRDHSIFPPSRTASGMSGSIGNGPYPSYPSALLNGSSGLGRSISGRQGSVDSFSTGGGQFQGAPSPLNSSPALSNGAAQSYNAPSTLAAAPSVLPSERDRQEREDFFKTLREKELASITPGPIRTNSMGSGMGGYQNGSFNSAPGGGIGIGQQPQPISRSPMYSQAVAASPVGSSAYQQNIPAQSAYHNAFPRPSSFQQPGQQQSGLPPSPYQPQQLSNNAWMQAPSGHLARQIVPPSSLIERPSDQWGSGSQDLYTQQQLREQSPWYQHQYTQQQAALPEPEPIYKDSRQNLPPISFTNLAARYSTVAAVQSVQSQSAGNFGLARGYVEPPVEQELVTPPEQTQSHTQNSTPIEKPVEAEVANATSQLEQVKIEDTQPTAAPEPEVKETPEPVSVPAPVEVAPVATRKASSARKTVETPAVVFVAPTKPVEAIPTSPEPTHTPAPKKKKAPIVVEPTLASESLDSPTTPPSTTSLAAPAKPAWTATPSAPTGPSLKEIQEAEAKRSEARKEKEKAARAAALAAAAPSPSGSDDGLSLPKTTTWGLGGNARGNGVPTPQATTTATAGASAWGSKGGAAKKTMKEILEEEERRKKVISVNAANLAASAAADSASTGKRAYVESAKVGEAKVPTPAAASNSVWTVVGSKSTPAAAASPVRTIPGAGPTTTPAKIAKPALISTPSTTKKAAASAASIVSGGNDAAPPPSVELIKWMKEALRGLTGVNSMFTFSFWLFLTL